MSKIEEAKYLVAEKHGTIEIRDYGPMIVAEAEVSGERKRAISQGFRLIADYIFGNNSAAEKVAMTIPVTQLPGEKIPMTAPLTQEGDGVSWRVRFVMPSKYTMATLPKPTNEAVTLKELQGKRFVVIRFSGIAGQSSLKRHTDELKRFISEHGLEAVALPTYAFYNPPWTLPFFRRNEVMVEIAK